MSQRGYSPHRASCSLATGEFRAPRKVAGASEGSFTREPTRLAAALKTILPQILGLTQTTISQPADSETTPARHSRKKGTDSAWFEMEPI